MARRKPRDYKAEYAATVARARAAGYKSEREYKKVRRELNLPPRTMPVPKRVLELNPLTRIRRENQAWSDAHSLRSNSKYHREFTDDQAERYHRAFVEDIPDTPEKLKRIHDFEVPFLMSELEWLMNPSTTPIRE